MILKHNTIEAGDKLRAEACVVGAGAAGIAAALELGRNGIDTLVIPGGDLRYRRHYQDLYKGTSDDQIPLEQSRHRRFGGTTAVWGGRCISFDPIDFEKRPWVPHSGWPLDPSQLVDYYRRSQDYLDLGSALSYDVASSLPGAPKQMIEGFKDQVLLTEHIEKFSLPTNFGRKYRREITACPTIRVVMGSHLVRINYTGFPGDVSALSCVTAGGTPFTCEAEVYVLAMGAFEVTRHLLQPSLIGLGNEYRSEPLGRYFMTHFSGVIAEVVIDEDRKVMNDYEVNSDGVYCRRRLQLSREAQAEAEILNFSAFLDHPPLEDPAHRDAVLSLIFLLKGLRAIAFRIPAEYSVRLAYGRFGLHEYLGHARNVLIGLPRLLVRGPELIYKRLIRRRKLPSVIIDSRNNRFALHYHVEHAPHPESRLTLSSETDEHGLRRLHVSMYYDDSDVLSIVKAHNIFRERLERSGVGTLEYLTDDPHSHVKEQIGWGGHQIGTTRMATSPSDGVVDANCRVFGLENLYVAGPSVFPTGSQANPVLTIVAMTIRLTDHLRSTVLSRSAVDAPE